MITYVLHKMADENQVIIERISFPEYEHPRHNCNFLPRPDDEDVASLDYDTEIARTNLTRYADLISYPVSHTYTFTTSEVTTILSWIDTGIICGKSSNLFKEDLEPIIDRMQKVWISGDWFVRFDTCSPKDGIGTLPIRSAKQMMDMIITSKRSRTALQGGYTTLYFVRFDPTWDPSRELRVFIHNRQITAISQYSPYQLSSFSTWTDSELTSLTHNMVQYLTPIISRVCEHIGTDNIVCDILVRGTDNIVGDILVRDTNAFHIIEFNSFGYWLASGGVLFHWLTEQDKLYNQAHTIHFKILI